MAQTNPPPPIPPAAQPSSQPALPPLSERLSRALGASTSSSDASSPGVVSSPGTSAGGTSTPPLPPGLFAYGTLTLDPVISALLDRVPPSRSVRAPGWRAAGLPGLPYPGLVPQRSEMPSAAGGGSGAPGRLYLDLGARDWAILDAFENPEYEIGLVTLEHGCQGAGVPVAGRGQVGGRAGQSLGHDVDDRLGRRGQAGHGAVPGAVRWVAAGVGGGGSPVWLIPWTAGRMQRAEAESAPSTYTWGRPVDGGD